jgi:C4-dicarboxylate-specific signal transduction histidine kinase
MIERLVEGRTRELEARSRQLEAEIIRRQNAEAQLLQAQKLESIGQLAAGIAHEINTPMQFLCDNLEFLSECSKHLFEVVDTYERNLFAEGRQRSWAERKQELRDMMERNRFDSIREQVPEAITESLDGIERVINIVRAMKEFAHPGSEQKTGVDLNNAVQSMVTITRNRWKYVAELELDLDPDLPTLNCVPADINQVLMNLIVNAADAIAEKVGDAGLEKGQITVRTGSDGRNVVIEVEDNGCGIPESIRNRIFDPFFTTKDVGQGTGQGLAICYNVVVNKHHGVIDVLSTPGAGTTFRVELPRTSSRPGDETQTPSLAEESAIPALA